MVEPGAKTMESPSLTLLKQQRTHVLFVLSNSREGRESAFLEWYRGPYKEAVSAIPGVLRVQHYERHEVDITCGRYPPLPFRYLSVCDITFDGAAAAEPLIDRIAVLHLEQPAAHSPATWLYYPVSEKVGRSPSLLPSMLTLAFTNSVEGKEDEFREWYATRHIRHALNVPALVSGQCFERSQFQKPGARAATFSKIALYEQEGTPESIIESFTSLPPGTFDFPTIDSAPTRFAEWVYHPLP